MRAFFDKIDWPVNAIVRVEIYASPDGKNWREKPICTATTTGAPVKLLPGETPAAGIECPLPIRGKQQIRVEAVVTNGPVTLRFK